MQPHDDLGIAIEAYCALNCGKEVPTLYTPRLGTTTVLIEKIEELDAQVDAILSEDCRIMGLDTEWDHDQHIALVQLAAGNCCLLMRPACLRASPQRLVTALADPRLLKFGVGIRQDIQLIEAQIGVKVRGGVELSALAAKHGHVEHGVGLAGICLSVLGCSLSKDVRIRCSDWASDLSNDQIHYASCDATVAVDIANHMYTSYAQPGASPTTWCEEFIDRMKSPSLKQMSSAPANRSKDKVLPKQTLYDNCKQLAPDGTHIATVRRKRAEYYIRHGLATLISEDPFEFQLLFEPKNMERVEHHEERLNRCVGCGKDDNFMRFHIVPNAFRSLLICARDYHDIVLLCRTCFFSADKAAQQRWSVLLKEHGVSSAGGKYLADKVNVAIAKLAWLLLDSRLPSTCRSQKLDELRKHLGRDCNDIITDEELRQLSKLKRTCVNPAWRSPEAHVVSAMQLIDGPGCEERAHDFVVAWRQDFLQAVQPKCLPPGWSVDHRGTKR